MQVTKIAVHVSRHGFRMKLTANLLKQATHHTAVGGSS